MTITLYLHKTTLLRDLQTIQHIITSSIELVEGLKKHYKPLNISSEPFSVGCTAIQVTLEEFALIGVFTGGL